MTEHTLAIAILVSVAYQVLPGSAYKQRPEVDWGKPGIYVALVQTTVILWLVWDVLS